MATIEELKYKAYLELKKAGKLNEAKPPDLKEKDLKQPRTFPHVGEVDTQPKAGKRYEEEYGKIHLTTDEKVYQGSYGIDPVLIRLQEILGKPTCKVNTILINISTCIRNAMDKDLSERENIIKIGNEISVIVETIADMFNRSVINYPYLVLYMENYIKDWPSDKVRPSTPGKMLYFDLVQHFYKLIDKNQPTKIGKTTVNFVKLNKGLDYGAQLQSVLRNISEVIPSATYTGNYCLVSHQPLDFHVLNKCPQGMIIASHTGEVITNRMLGYKVFNEESIPFNMLTHSLLGDKYQIKPSVSIKARKDIREKAYINKWYLKTEPQIKQELRNIGIIIK